MKMKKQVLGILGSAIKKHGFELVTDPAYMGPATWTFSRKVGEITQYITVSKNRFADEFCMDFRTTAWGKGIGSDAVTIIPEDKLHKYHTDASGWPYKTEEDFERILHEFVDVIEKYGLDELARLSIEDEVVPKVEMGQKLYSSHESLSEEFAKQNQLNTTDRTHDNREKWFDVIEEKIMSTKDSPYNQEVQDMLTSIAAFLGTQLVHDLGGEWLTSKNARVPIINGMNVHAYKVFSPLKGVVMAWKRQCVGFLREYYFLILDAKLPLTTEQKVERTDRLTLIYSKYYPPIY